MSPVSHPSLPPLVKLVLARWAMPGALLALSVSGCNQKAQFAHGDGEVAKNCEEGTLDCFCHVEDQSCEPGLLCIDDLCVDPNASIEPKPKPSPGPMPDSSESSSATGDDSQESSSEPEPETEQLCETDEDCEDENPCTEDRCVDFACSHDAQSGLVCDDQNPCTANDRCDDGVCSGRDTRVLNENFSSLPLNWLGRRGTLEDGFIPDGRPSSWQIGGAVPSNCASKSEPDCGEDPAQDFSPGDDNTLAGVVIGGCHEQKGDWVWDCFFSPFFETNFFDTQPRFSYRRHLHAPGVRLDGRKRGVEHRIVLRGAHDSIETLIQGYEGVINDRTWIEDAKSFASRTDRTSIGFCYRRSSFSESFAGWSIDEVRVAQTGCTFDDF